MYKIPDLKISFLGVVPHFEDKTGQLDPQEILALSALLTFKGKSIQNLKKEIAQKGQNLGEQVKKILKGSSLRGHASMSTTPVLAFAYEGSKFLDLALTGIIFSSSLVASGRRTDVSPQDIVIPSDIQKNKKALKIYLNQATENIKFFNELLSKGITKDEARKIYQYGVYGTGIMSLSIESLITLQKEWETEKDWMPEEIGLLLKEIEKYFKKIGLDWLYITRAMAPKESYPYPNIFKNPKKENLVRLMRKKLNPKTDVEIFDLDVGEKKALQSSLGEIAKYQKKHPQKWSDVLALYRQIVRDFGLSLSFKVFSACSLGVWTEKKRHRTVPMIVDSIYGAVEKTKIIFEKYQKKILSQNLKPKEIEEIELYFAIPPGVARQTDFLYRWLKEALLSLKVYHQLIKLKISPRSALFIVPRGVKLDVIQEYNLFNLILGYYPTRLCSTADEQILRMTTREEVMLKKIFKSKKLSFLNSHLGPKCFLTGFCPEKNWCPKILGKVRGYNDKAHAQVHQKLEEDFENNLRKISE